jgi:hypothetical protein
MRAPGERHVTPLGERWTMVSVGRLTGALVEWQVVGPIALRRYRPSAIADALDAPKMPWTQRTCPERSADPLDAPKML